MRPMPPPPHVLEPVLPTLHAVATTVVPEARFFTSGVVRTNLGRLPWTDRLRFVARAVGRRLVSAG